LRLLTTSQGVNLSWLAFWDAFLVVNLGLVIRAHLRQGSLVTFQIILSYATWTAFISACLRALLWRGTELWDRRDTATVILVAADVSLTWLLVTAAWLGR
jgi:hypothetical protein